MLLPTSLNHSQRSSLLPPSLPSSLPLTCLCLFAYWLENLVSRSGCGAPGSSCRFPSDWISACSLHHTSWIEHLNPILNHVPGHHLTVPPSDIKNLTGRSWGNGWGGRGRGQRKQLPGTSWGRDFLRDLSWFLCPSRRLMGPARWEGGRGGEVVHLLQKQ